MEERLRELERTNDMHIVSALRLVDENKKYKRCFEEIGHLCDKLPTLVADVNGDHKNSEECVEKLREAESHAQNSMNILKKAENLFPAGTRKDTDRLHWFLLFLFIVACLVSILVFSPFLLPASKNRFVY